MASPRSTTNLLAQLRALMNNKQYVAEPIQAYIVPSNDAHNSEYLASCDQFRAFISGFDGSVGTAIITQQDACLWTDGRYFLQASQQLDNNWTLMKEGIPTTPSQDAWLLKVLPTGSRVGVDPKLYTYKKYIPLQAQLEAAGHKLVPVSQNLVELVWKDQQPQRPTNTVFPLALKYSGKTIKEKLQAIHQQMKEKNAKYLVLTALDEIAWFLNLRGSDIAFNPVFFSYVIIAEKSYTLFINPKQVTAELKQHLTDESTGFSFTIEPYDKVEEVLKGLAANIEGMVWTSENASFAITRLVPKKNLLTEATPTLLMKAVKNPVEIKGMRNAHIKDAAALCCYFNWLEKNVKSGKITEISGAQKLEDFRKMQEDFMGPSFDTISSVGPHGAIIHYKPSVSTDCPIRSDCLYLCDSGGQYRDGTTDVTRTMHFGTPTDFERECFTRVLKGQLKIAQSIFPTKIKGNCLDSFARDHLWQIGLDYGHGTGHGIGSFLNVHEGPIEISWRSTHNDPGLEAGMFVSNEPGFYQDGSFGIRIEDIVEIVEAKTPYNFNNRGFLAFETITLMPKQTKMIKTSLLTDEEIKFLNDYHQECRDVVGPLLEKQGQLDAKAWLWKETEPIKK